MSYSMRFVVTPLPASDETLFDRIKEAAQKLTRPTSTTTSTTTTTTTTTTSSSSSSTAATTTTTAAAAAGTAPTTSNDLTIATSSSNATSTPPTNPQANINTSVIITPTTTTSSYTNNASQQQQHQQLQQQQQPHTTTFNAIKSTPVSQIAVGPAHIALLLEDGRICRASYQIQPDRLEFLTSTNTSAHVPSSSITSTGSNNNSGLSGANVSSNHQHTLQHFHNGAGSQVSTITKTSFASSSNSANNNVGLSNGPGIIGNPPNIAGVITSTGLDGRITSSGGANNPLTAGNVTSNMPNSGVLPPISGRGPNLSGMTNPSHRQAARRGRMLRHVAARGRSATSVIMGSRAVIPAQYVPEDLINQAQVVLQGKPRSAIVRELQRTNLDVNSAVNNLLSSDNEDPEDMDESQDYLPNEDLMSLLDSSVSLQSGPTSVLIDAETVFPEDVFNSYSARSRPSLRHSVGSGRATSDRESSLASELEIRRMANRDPAQSRRWLEHALRDSSGAEIPTNRSMNSVTATDFTLHHKNDSSNQYSPGIKKTSPNTSSLDVCPMQISETIEIWPGDKKFIQIACMHSELIAISSTGQLHQWKWSEPMPYEGIRYGDVTNYHPKVAQLNLTHEKIQLLSATCIRSTVITESNKVATWIDDTINIVANKLEHGAQNYPEFQRGDKVSQLHTCSLYTCIRLESGAMYWWGVAPFSQRKKNWKKIQSKAYKHGGSGGSGSNEIGVGSIVCRRISPSFGEGAVGFTTKDGVPRVGRLVESAWNITDTCKFKIIQPTDKRTQQLIQQASQSSESKNSTAKVRKMLGQPIDFSGNTTEDLSPTSPGISKNSSSERLEMPPPPSPASSTCSEPGCSTSNKRRRLMKDEDKTRDDEHWNLKDVIFLEEVKKPPAAKVVKLDGNTALVRFNQRDPFGHQTDSDVNAYLRDCQMIRKDELQLAKETTSSSRIIDCQRSPKKLNISDSGNFLTFTISNNGIHALVKNGDKIEYKMYQLASGKVTKSLLFPTDSNAFLGRDPSLITLYASGESDIAVTLRDGNGCLYPLAKDFLESLKEPQPLDMSPVQALSMAVHPLRDPVNPNRTNPTLVLAMALENQILIPAVLRSDPEFVKLTLASLDKEPVSQQIVASEIIDLNRNILHAAVYSCAPGPTRSNSDKNRINEDSYDAVQSTMSRISVGVNDFMKRSSRGKQINQTSNSSTGGGGVIGSSQNVNSSSTLDLSSDGESRSMQGFPESISDSMTQSSETINDWPSNSIFNKFHIDPDEQKQSAHMVLLILVESPMLKPYLKDLMIQRDAHGMTPFMSAVSRRAYTAAIILLDLAQWIISQDENTDPEYKQRLFTSMIFPRGTNLDNNPLYTLCANDTCSFTWTGATHINQDIFECKTCGLTKTLCCCTECARTCHKGHDCRLKKQSPSAYCDCWEKCKCKSLVPGCEQARLKLLERLLADTDLVTYPDSKGESILLFLVQTVGRQMIEQRHYGPDRQSRHNKRDDPMDMPDHDLSPPRFARKALKKMLGEWLALKSVIMAGTNSSHNLANATKSNSLLNAEDQIFLSGQQGTALLDRFTHSVLIKICPDMLDVLLTTIIRESSSIIPSRVYEARLVAKRFVRSVARNGVVLSVELSPINYSQPINIDLPSTFNPMGGNNSNGGYGGSNSWKPSQQPAPILQKCRKVFQALLPIAAEELAEIADALISPVRLGVPRPTAPFSLVNSMAEATQGSEEIFVVEPIVLPNTSNLQDHQMPNARPSVVSIQQAQNQVSNNDAPILNEGDRIPDMLYDSEMAIDTIDSEDAEASNNTFRPSNNGESDSDSDSNGDDVSFQSNIDPNGARSSTTVPTVGSEIGASTVAYFSEPESGDSSNAEDEDDESEANDTEHDNDDLTFNHDDSFPFPRRSTITQHSTGSQNESIGLVQQQQQQQQQQHQHHQHQHQQQQQAFRSTNLGQQLHWALRHRDHSFYPPPPTNANSIPSTAVRLASIGLTNAYTYLDAPSRRSVITSSSQANNLSATNPELSMSTTAVGLSRAFSIIIRSISDLIPSLKESIRSESVSTNNQLKVSPAEAETIICNLEKKLNPVWEWLFKVMDSTEGQLRFGCALTNGIQAVTQSSHSSGSSHANQFRNSSLQAAIGNPGSLAAASSYFPQTNSNLLPVHPMLARVNANLTVHGLNRRDVQNMFDETRARIHNSAAVPPLANTGVNATLGLPGSDPSNIRLHNPIGHSSGNRPQPLTTTRSNLAGPSYVTRIPQQTESTSEQVDGTTAARRDFLSYMISLIRGHGNEHHDSLPSLDVSSLRHIAYVFDAYIYYLQALNRNKLSKTSEDLIEDFDSTLPTTNQTKGNRHNFFRRSESTLFLDGIAPDPFSTPLAEALPLAEQPHLLQPSSRREELFGIPKTNIQDVNVDSLPLQLSLSAPASSACPRCLAKQQQHQQAAQLYALTNPGNPLYQTQMKPQMEKDSLLCAIHKRSNDIKYDLQHTALLGRWRLTVELFGREFLDDVGAEPGSILTDLVGFSLKENRFRKEMERLRSESAPREISLINVDRDKNTLIRQTIKELNNTYYMSERSQSRRNQELPLLACSKVKVSFKDEKGEGNGVARSFYTAFCEAVLSNEKLANIDVALFYQPGLRNFYSPRQGDANPDRLNAFRNVGRIIGICLSQSEICPIQLNRHVIKYILGKQISWHDLAFFDPVLYESLRQLVLDEETNPYSSSSLQTLDLRFCVDLCLEEGGGQVELAPNGRNVEVTRENIYEYVRRYALKRMLKSQEKSLQAMRQGVMDVLPACALDNLTSEDFRLLLNGVGEINVQTLISYTSFIDDRGTSAGKRNSVQVDEQLGYFKKWFWSIVEKMTTKERQDLVYFWTGSPSLPASEEGFQPMPTVSIRPAEDLHLPTSNVCIFRLYIPLYSSKAILRSKLLIAIKEKNFGFI